MLALSFPVTHPQKPFNRPNASTHGEELSPEFCSGQKEVSTHGGIFYRFSYTPNVLGIIKTSPYIVGW